MRFSIGRLPLCPATVDPAFDAVGTAPVSADTWHLAPAGCRRRQAQAPEVQALPQPLAGRRCLHRREAGSSILTSPKCRLRKYEEGQKTVRGTVFPTIGSISLLASVARQGIGNAREGTGQPSSPSPNSLQQRTERLPGSSCSTCWKPCPIRSTPFSPIEPLERHWSERRWRGAFSSPSSPETATPSTHGRCALT